MPALLPLGRAALALHTNVSWADMPCVAMPRRSRQAGAGCTARAPQLHATAGRMACAGAALLAALPASAAQSGQGVAPLDVASAAVYSGLCVGSASLTALLCARHMMSWFPHVERQRREAPWVFVKRSTDPLLAPLRAVLDTAEVSEHLSPQRKPTTVDRRPEWSNGVDLSPVAALCFLRILDEALGTTPGANELTTVQDVALFAAWSAIYLRWIALL